jgi:hypothetical protein
MEELKMWTKKLDEMHYSKDSKTLCGRPCLGNNYAKAFTLKDNMFVTKCGLPERKMCKECEKLKR